jgi:hypothetical protein
MPNDLYDRDVVAWSEHQAALLRRVARGERVNDIDWDHVVEEIEDVGNSQLNAVHSYLRQLLAHLLKLSGWPGSDACQHWRNEVATFQVDAIARSCHQCGRGLICREPTNSRNGSFPPCGGGTQPGCQRHRPVPSRSIFC